jgi:hypothetical protein
MKYYIRDCADNIVGNPKGYDSHKSATIALSRRYKGWCSLREYLWYVYDEACSKGHTGGIVSSIKLAK